MLILTFHKNGLLSQEVTNDGSVISNVALTPNLISNDNNNGNSDHLVYEPVVITGPNNAMNNRLL